MTASRNSRSTPAGPAIPPAPHDPRAAAARKTDGGPPPADGIGAFAGRLLVEESAIEPFHGGPSEAVHESLIEEDPLPEDRFSNRELSWLDFNARVLALAEDKGQRLLERAKFLAIFASNLDEFYMVRVAGLKRRRDMGLSVTSADGLTASEQLALISTRTQELVDRQGRCFTDDIMPALAESGIRIVHWGSIDPEDRERLADYFTAQIFPVLTPLAVDPAHPFPYISGLSLNMAIIVRDPETRAERFARVKVPNNVDRFVRVRRGVSNT